MADWEEIKRLAADFQRAQLSSTTQRLSERNCIEIVQRLTSLGLIEVIYTIDGKEYLTPQELGKEIREELIVHGGRINLVELQQILNVDLSHIQAKAAEVVSSEPNVTLILGQLVDESYLDSICEEINDKLEESGQMLIADITKQYDLPADFLLQAVQHRLGSIIKGQLDDSDDNVLFTEAFVSRHRAIIRGALSAITRPTPVMNLINQFGLQERLFYSILDDLVSSGRLSGSISGGRQDRTLYLPSIYTEAQNLWVDNFFAQNGYLEFDSLTRLGISDPKGFIKRRIKDPSLVFLKTCCVGGVKLDQIEAEVDESLASGTFVDIMSSLPSVFSPSDANQLLQKFISSKDDCEVFCDTIVVSEKFIKECAAPFDKLMATKADKDAKQNAQLLMQSKAASVDDQAGKEEKKDQRRKKAAVGKQGGGTQGRESKTKSVKKKYKPGRGGAAADDGSDDESVSTSKGRALEIPFMSSEEIEEELQKDKRLEYCPEDLVTEIAQHLYRPLRRQYQEVARSVFLQSVGSGTSSARRKVHSDLEEQITGLYNNVLLFEKGIKHFTDDTASHLMKHLLKTLCTDITNLAFNAVATQHMVSLSEQTEITAEVRLKLLGKLPDDNTKAILSKLHSSLTAKTTEEFLKQLDAICGTGHLEILLKKPDKKKERQLVFAHRQALAEQLRGEEQLAMGVHLAAALLFTVHTQNVVHAPGRCVPAVISLIDGFLQPDQRELLTAAQDLVMQQLKLPTPPPEGATEELASSCKVKLAALKEMALKARRSQGQEDKD